MKLKTSWRKLPLGVRRHLEERLMDRSITEDDLYKLGYWLESEPDVPERNWYKDFGTFKLAGRGSLILTFLRPGQIAHGTEIED